MNAPKSRDELASQIQLLVRAYLAEAEQAAEEALAHAFLRPTPSSCRPPQAVDMRGSKRRQQGPRRSAEALAELANQLAAAIASKPGESMKVFTQEFGVGVRELHRPMTLLKDQGRIRSVGQRHLTRYFPTPRGRGGA